MKRIKYIILFILMVPVIRLDAQEPVVSATLDTNHLLIGDQIHLRLSFTGQSGIQVLWPVIPDTFMKNIEVLDLSPLDTVTDPAKQTTTYSQDILLTSFDTGFYIVPSVSFCFRKLPDTTLYSAGTRNHFFAVHTVAVDTTKPIKPIKGPLRAPLTFREVLPWLLLATAGIGFITLLIYYLKKRKKKEPLIRLRPRVVLKPHEIALSELEKLRVKKLWQQGKIKEYFSELTDILRKYIEDSYGFMALESTTREILDGLHGKDEMKNGNLELLGEVLVLADLVKFARERPPAGINEECLEKGIRFVNNSTFHLTGNT